MVLAKKNRSAIPQRLAQSAANPQFLTQPHLHCLDEHATRTWKSRPIACQDAFKLQQRFFVEDDIVEISRLDAASREAVARRTLRKARVVLLATEPLLLGRRNDDAVAQQARRGIVIEAGNPQDVQARTAASALRATGASAGVRPIRRDRGVDQYRAASQHTSGR